MSVRFLSRRSFLVGLGSAAVAAAGAAIYGRFGEPHWLEISRRRIRIHRGDGAAAPVRIVHLSDFHASRVVPYAFIAESVTAGIAEQPDLIALTGDFFTKRAHDLDRYVGILRRLSAAAPAFACLGNHDGGPWTRVAGGNATIDEALLLLRAAGIRCLQNDAAELSLRGRALQMIGVGDLWSGLCHPAEAFARAPSRGTATRILLNHNPDAKEALRPFDWDVMLCGHTHGGQIRIPFLGTPFAPVADKRYVEGLHRWSERWLNITRGVGNLHGVRLNCRPEICVIELL